MSAEQRGPRASEPVGSVAEEAARLIGLFAGQLSPDQMSAAGARAAGPARAATACPTCGHEADVAQPDSVCRSCPVCRVLSVVRAISPDALDRVADVVDLLSDGLRAYAGSRRANFDTQDTARARGSRATAAGAGGRPGRERARPGPGARPSDTVGTDPGPFVDLDAFDPQAPAGPNDADADIDVEVEVDSCTEIDPFDPFDPFDPESAALGGAEAPGAREAEG